MNKPVIGLILLFQLLGFFLSLWAILVMKLGNFNIQPEVKTDATLTKNGPYKLIRNPMYSGLLIFFGASLFSSFDLIEMLVFIMLVVIFLLKINLEEKFLSEKFGESYRMYKEKTFRLLPYVY
ncbi:methyltransferase family protein [Lutimonas sp.]|uniref:methyltransferase family protein n=1 Tax=Lutimonas sp. TaxID=1872403 RepID=UPI003D9B964D